MAVKMKAKQKEKQSVGLSEQEAKMITLQFTNELSPAQIVQDYSGIAQKRKKGHCDWIDHHLKIIHGKKVNTHTTIPAIQESLSQYAQWKGLM